MAWMPEANTAQNVLYCMVHTLADPPEGPIAAGGYAYVQ
jgi:hypothetical protein